MKAHKLGENMKEDTRIALLEQSIGHINETMTRIEKRFDSIDKRFDSIDKRFDRVEARLDSLDGKIDSNFKWLLGLYIAGYAGLLGVLAHAVHWI